MYESIEELPSTVKDVLPKEAQEIYLEAFNKSWESYEDAEWNDMSQDAVANRDGWTAVRREFVKDEETGEWFAEAEAPEDVEEEEGILDKLGDIASGQTG